MKTIIQHFRHEALQKSLAKSSKTESLPDIAKLSIVEAGKKPKVEEKGVVNLKGGAAKKGDEEFADFGFKEGNTQVIKMQDIYI